MLAFCCLAGCAADERPVQMGGAIFGTTWSLTYLGAPDEVSPAQVQSEINAAFALVNESMNHYDPSSLISEFNALPAQTPIEVDWDFTYVLSAALELTAATHGAYDVSVSALSDLWGFGPEGPKQFPDAADIEMTRAQVGVAQLDWESTTRTLSKRAPGLKLDFSSLAKGYAVDLGVERENIFLDDFGG